MNNQAEVIKWATTRLASKGYPLQRHPEIILSTPWSVLIRFATTKVDFYLKQTPAAISLEPQIIQLLSEQFYANVPILIDINDDLCCFLMIDAGKTLRETFQSEFNPELLCQAIEQYSAVQRATEDRTGIFIKLGVPDWRLDKLPILYDQMVARTELLKSQGMAEDELQILRELSAYFLEQCTLLSKYGIRETIGIPDFNDNNILINLTTRKLTFIDWGESTIIHPFFSLNNCLLQAIKHHGVKENDQVYKSLQAACCKNWLELIPENQLLEIFSVIKKLWPIYSILGNYRLRIAVDVQALDAYYVDRPNQIAALFREYIRLNQWCSNAK